MSEKSTGDYASGLVVSEISSFSCHAPPLRRMLAFVLTHIHMHKYADAGFCETHIQRAEHRQPAAVAGP